MRNLALLFIVISFPSYVNARRYRTCQEGCCVHEYCAYHRICYPRIHCSLGCPDGQCVGKEQKPPVSQPEALRQNLVLSSGKSKQKSHESPALSERYSYQDKPEPSSTENTDKAKNKDILSGNDGSGYDSRSAIPVVKSPVQVTDGICMPYQPCVEGDYCGLGHSCTFNYNLGYHVCQYNLDIGSTLCYDNKGRPALQSLS